MKREAYYCILIALILLTNSELKAQKENLERFSVEWMESYITEEDFGKEDGIFGKILQFILGDSKKRLVTPFNLVKLDKNRFFVLDHGYLQPMICDKSGIKFVENDSIKIFPSLVGVCKFKSGVLFTDSQLNKIFYYSNSDDELREFKTNTELHQPTGICTNINQTRIYVSETKEHRIVVFDKDGNFIKYVGKRGETKENFNFPTSLVVDSKDNLLILDVMNFKLKIYDSDLKYYKSFGAAGDATGYFSRPKALAVDSYNHIFIVDALFHTVQVFDEEGNFLYSFGGQGRNRGRMWLPTGIFIDDDNNIYIADSYNSRIQKFRLINGEK